MKSPQQILEEVEKKYIDSNVDIKEFRQSLYDLVVGIVGEEKPDIFPHLSWEDLPDEVQKAERAKIHGSNELRSEILQKVAELIKSGK